jgi:hypothetical protein
VASSDRHLDSLMSANTQGNAARLADEDALALELASLSYPGLSHLRPERERNYPELDWEWLMTAAKAHDLQNRLGFVTSVARRLAEMNGESDTAALLGRREAELEQSRLEREDTLCHDSLTEPEKRWLRERRSENAKRWGLLTDLSTEHLTHAA